MTNPTIADLMDFHIVAILRRLKGWMRPFQQITEEITILKEENNLTLVGENDKRIRFDRQAVAVVRRMFKGAEWALSAPVSTEGLEGLSLLIGILPKNHYLILAPKRKPEKKK